jgi:hypothetical protein
VEAAASESRWSVKHANCGLIKIAGMSRATAAAAAGESVGRAGGECRASD